VKIRAFINTVAVEIIVNVLIIIFSFVIMFIYSAKLALYILTIIPVFTAVYLIFNRINKIFIRRSMEQSAELESQLVESLGNMGTTKRYGSERNETLRFESKFVPFLKSSFAVNKNSILAHHMNELLTGIFILILLWAGTYKVLERELSLGELISLYSIFGYLLHPLSGLISMNRFIQDAMIAADRLFQIFDIQTECIQDDCVSVREIKISMIRLEDVSFRYGSGMNILERVNLEIKTGTFTAIVGTSGSGKSTLLNLMQGVYAPANGKIYYDQFDSRFVQQSYVKKAISCVPQKIDLFSGTLAENICLSEHKPDAGRIYEIFNDLGAGDLIRNLPEGIFTMVGERGNKFSGGELQKIGLARSLYRDPQILLLDEPGSSMDYISESWILNLLVRLKQSGKTVVLVTHRLRSVTVCDMIYVLKDGKIKEAGTHSDLLSRKGNYYQLWINQYEGLEVI
jgi:ATP-binding cassette subfamily B protein